MMPRSWRTAISRADCPCHKNRWRWEVEFHPPNPSREIGYAYTHLGAKFAVWRVERLNA